MRSGGIVFVYNKIELIVYLWTDAIELCDVCMLGPIHYDLASHDANHWPTEDVNDD